MKIRPMFAWYDFWVGLFWDSAKLRELWLERINLDRMLTLDELLAWSAERESEIRELLNIER